MIIIPVIDLRGGHVVRAVAGQRQQYQAKGSPLCPSTDPVDVAVSFFALYSFTTLYVADLDAIEGTGNNRIAIKRLLAKFPQIKLWVDAGFRTELDLRSWSAIRQLRPVLGSENHRDPDRLAELLERCRPWRPVLSLDFITQDFLGPIAFLSQPWHWPDDVILMTLHRIGVNTGPAFAQLEQLRGRVPDKRIYAAGGVRDNNDLHSLANLGCHGVLLATALHERRISRADIASIADTQVKT